MDIFQHFIIAVYLQINTVKKSNLSDHFCWCLRIIPENVFSF